MEGFLPPKLPVRAGEGALQGTVGHSLRIGDGTAPERIGVALTAAVTAISSINAACAEGLA